MTKQPQEISWEKELLGAIARGWCDDKNSSKEMDSDLAVAIANEVKSFIQNLLTSDRKRVIDEIEGMKKEILTPSGLGNNPRKAYEYGVDTGYAKALTDIILKINYEYKKP